MSPSTQREIAKLLLDVSNACQEVIDYCATTSRDEFVADRTLQHVIAHLVIVMGEALRRAERLDPTLASTIPQLRDVIDTRNRIVHGYDSINYWLLWDIAIEEIPPLMRMVRGVMDRLDIDSED